jgi:hypothetical protein
MITHINSDARCSIRELTSSVTKRSPLAEKSTFTVKDPDPRIMHIGDVDIVMRINRNTVRTIELTGTGALRSYAFYNAAIGVELQELIGTSICQIYQTI